jgi:ParB family chromosome partitioning protein
MGENYELISGERRLRASRELGLNTVPCVIMEIDEQKSAEISIIENLIREDLNIFEQAGAIESLIDTYGLTQEQIAKRLSNSQSFVANKLRLLRLSASEREKIIENNLTERHARALLRLSGDNLRLKALKMICQNNYNVAQTEELIDKILESLAEPKKEKGRIKGVIHLRMFVNSINKAVDMVKKAGVNVETTKTEKDECIEYLIKIPKRSPLAES